MEREQGHILVVDDNQLNRMLLTHALEAQGYAVTAAEDGQQALARLQTDGAIPVDVVLLDILMPRMDGYQTLAHIKQASVLRHIPVIMISALDEMEAVIQCIELGAEDYLPKPFDPVLLKARIGACLEKKRFRDQEMEYLRHVAALTGAAAALEAGTFDPAGVADVVARADELGQLARVFQRMAREILAREHQLRQAALEREERLTQQLRELQREFAILSPVVREAFDMTPPFDFLTSQEKDWLADRIQSLSFPDRWTVSGPHDTVYDHLFLLFQGRVVIRSADDEQRVQGYIEAPAYFGERSVFFDQAPGVNFVSDGLVRCFALAGADVRLLVAANDVFRHAFATALRRKHRIFHGYEAFVNMLLTEVDRGVLQLRDLVDVYRGLHSILHQTGSQDQIDFDALAYVLPRLPDNVTALTTLVLAEDFPEMYGPVRDSIRAPTRRAKKREYYQMLPNKIMVLLRDRKTDTVDLVTKLCIYTVETGKLRERLIGSSGATSLARLALCGQAGQDTEEVLATLPFTGEEVMRLKRLFGADLLHKLYELLVQVGDLTIYVQKANHRYITTAPELWLRQIRKAAGDILGSDEFDRDLAVHVVSSNTHSVYNCLSPWLHERATTILSWADQALPASCRLLKPADRLYYAFRSWAEAHAGELQHRDAADRACGIHRKIRLETASCTWRRKASAIV